MKHKNNTVIIEQNTNYRIWRDSVSLTSNVAAQGSISGKPYGSLSTASVIPACRAPLAIAPNEKL